METRNVKITIETAKKWYTSDNESLRQIALQAFKEQELQHSYKDIKTLQDACKVLNINYGMLKQAIKPIEQYSIISAYQTYVQIIRKALNKEYTMELTQGTIYYPLIYFKTENSNSNPSETTKIGEIKYKYNTYSILGGCASHGAFAGLGLFNSDHGVGSAHTDIGFLGCATYEIAKHFSKYFGVLIMKAMYGDLPNIQIYTI